LPATSVTALAIQPPVQLSAVTRVRRDFNRLAPVASAVRWSCSSLGACMDGKLAVFPSQVHGQHPVHGIRRAPAHAPDEALDACNFAKSVYLRAIRSFFGAPDKVPGYKWATPKGPYLSQAP